MNIKEKQKELNRIFEENGVVLAYLFGSAAKNKTGPLSDLDIAVLFSKEVPKEKYFDRKLKIAGEIGRVFKINKVDVVNLETASSPLLKYNAVLAGRPIFIKNQNLRFDLERKIMQEYEDTKCLREMQSYFLKKHIQEGIYGKARLSPKQERVFLKYVNG